MENKKEKKNFEALDFKKIENRPEFTKFKNKVISNFKSHINHEIKTDYKKAVLLTYWLNEYRKYLIKEKTFNPIYNPVYEYGSIVEIDFGFNIGSEYGGLHYAVVITKQDKKSSPVLNVIPLTSKNKNKLNKYSVDLNTEFYDNFKEKIYKLENNNNIKLKNLANNLVFLTEQSQKHIKNIDVIDENEKNFWLKMQTEFQSEQTELLKKQSELLTCKNKIAELKQGSVALVSQITTVSKIRIKDPLDTRDPLYSIKISDESMKKIKDRIINLY